ncbi:hypothetical protein F4780DRAFT_732676 [Xylariomycetidae sp. FL0641]|nr:hypothetical protein F4780DRAFT_732676 [Xylariomycetidae sp. FL0641]
MAGSRATRLQVGSLPWIIDERSAASQIATSEVEEFSFSARNDFDWLNEHMADIFSENQINVAEIFKTPGKLRGKTPRTARRNGTENRVPLSDIFSSTPKGAPNPFARPNAGRSITPKVKIAADPQPPRSQATTSTSPLKQVTSPKRPISDQPLSIVDSGYHGSQSQDAMDLDEVDELAEPTQSFSTQAATRADHVAFHLSPTRHEHAIPEQRSPVPMAEIFTDQAVSQHFDEPDNAATPPAKKLTHHESTTPAGSPFQADEPEPVHDATSHDFAIPDDAQSTAEPLMSDPDAMDIVAEEPAGSPSDGSSPIRPIVRKSSLNFASLPAREPITHKSIGNRISRTSHLDLHRTSYYSRQTGGKSLGHTRHELTDDENDDMELDDEPDQEGTQTQVVPDNAVTHNKTYTQRLQDQISKLGQPQVQAARTSKSNPEPQPAQASATAFPATQPIEQLPAQSPPMKTAAPSGSSTGAEDVDWIEPPVPSNSASGAFSPRPTLAKSHTTDVMEGFSGKDTVSGNEFAVSKKRHGESQSSSPQRPKIPERTTSHLGHHKSVSVPALPMTGSGFEDEDGLRKAISASNPPLASVPETERPTTPTKSPSRGFGNSPLKQVKNKLSSILKSSKGLLASSAAASADGKTLLLSPTTSRFAFHAAPSTEILASPSSKNEQPLYPDLSRQTTNTQTIASSTSPARTDGRRTRASIEKEKAEEKRKDKEAKEARRMAEQMEKLEKAREKEREKARVFSKEQERVAALEKQAAAQKEQERRAVAATPAPKATRTSPRRAQQQPAGEQVPDAGSSDDKAAEDTDMVDAPNPMPPPSVPRSAVPASAAKAREIKRPVRPTKEPIGKAKQAPTVIRVNMGSQHSQYHPSNTALSSNLGETLSQSQSKSKAPMAKPSLQSLKSSTSSVGRPKALEAAARRKEQEEREAQRKREAKAELERRRAAAQEEERRQEQQRKLEIERQREEERKQAAAQAEAKKNAQRQAILEKAKQTRAPPPVARSQPNGPPDYSRSESGPARPASRIGPTAQRSHEEAGRLVNTVLAGSSKASMKRPLQQDQAEDQGPRQAQSRSGTGYQSKETKRMRMTDELNEGVPREKQPSLKGAPVRPSAGLKKEMPAKSMYSAGYVSASQNSNRDLFKTTVTSQHNSQMKAAHPLDMAQVSKGPIPFASSTNAAGPAYKTPGRPQGMAAVKSVAKSGTRSSPRFQNGESIELPEINTDDEDEEEDEGPKGMVAAWADSPNLHRALVEQESVDPFQVFGPPGPLNMEEVFAKSKERFQKFRQRTSSANWSGADRLTEEDIRKDLAARDKMRREGGWSYEMSRDMV